MPVIDLNADLAEHDSWTDEDGALLDHVTSASLA
jgi:lactam utilization protein B